MHLQSRNSNNDLGPRRSAMMYFHVIKDSHSWVDLKQILEWLKCKFETVDKQYLKIGLENTLKTVTI